MERITLNMVPTGVLEICHASQYDIGREIRFDLINGTDDFVLSGDEDITIFIRDFDGNLIESSAPNTSSNYVVWTSSEGELDVSGPAICELRVTKDDDVLGSANFIMEIEADAYDGTSVHVETVGPADICTFETTLPEPLQSVIVNIEATGGNGTPDNPNPINGYTEANIVNTQNESIADLFSIDSDFRGTVAFNQHLQYTNAMATRSQFGLTFTRSDNAFEFHIVGNFDYESGDRNSYIYIGSPIIPYIEGHVYLVTNTSEKIRCNVYGITGTGNAYLGQNNLGGTIKKATTSGEFSFSLYFGANIENGTDFDETVKLNLFDLTKMFGSTIADYIYSLEQNNAGAGVAFFRSIYPADYYDYDVGTTEIVGKETPEATIAFGQTVYGGVLDVTRGKLTVTWTIIDLGDETLNYSYNSTYHRFDCSNDLGAKPAPDNNTPANALCSCYKNGCVNDVGTDDKFFYIAPASGNGKLCVVDTDYSDVASFKTAVSGQKVAFELATPFDIDLTPEVILAIVGTNNVFADCGQTTVKYLKAGA